MTFNSDKRWFEKALSGVQKFVSQKGLGQDPFAQIYEERRKGYSLFEMHMSDAEIEQIRPYIFNYEKLPASPTDKPVATPNLIAGTWSMPSQTAEMKSLSDRRITLAKMPDSGPEEVEAALSCAFDFWKSLKWADETVAYRKHVVKNFSRMMHYFYPEIIREIRVCIPKTKLEADKDFWEAKRAADHLEGSAERTMLAKMLPTMVEGQSYWKNEYLPGGVAAIFTPMNFIYGIPVIQFIGAYLSGCPLIYKGHPFGAIPNTTMMRMLMASGADPRAVQKIEGFGGRIGGLVSDPRVAVVSITGSDETAALMQSKRGLRPVKFEGGGCNWSYVDDGFSDEDLNKIAVRLAYSKLGFSSHKCTTLNGVAASAKVLDKLLPMISKEMDSWQIKSPVNTEESDTKVVGPCMVHKAQTATLVQEAAKKAGATVFRAGGKVSGSEYADHAEVIAPIIIKDVTPEMKITVNWDEKGERTVPLATNEWFMPILISSPMSFEEFLQFALVSNPHDLAVSLWSRSDQKLSKARRVLAGMLKENDGTDSALEWEEFGAGGVGPSGNMGVGDPEGTFAIYCRRQKGRHLVF